MSRILPSLVILGLLAGCVRTTPELQSPQPVSAAPELVAREFNLRPLESGITPNTESAADSPPGGPGTAASFGLYVLALSWAPNFCCTPPGQRKQECRELNGSFGATHLTIHGLWPNYTDAEMPSSGKFNYPSFCAPYTFCKRSSPSSCNPDPKTIPEEMRTYGPGYVTDNYSLAKHEWPKHGSCTGLDSGTYFSAALSAFKKLPGSQGSPELLTKNVGGTVSATELRAAFGSPESVMLGCDKDCNLQQVSICLANDSGQPGDRTACPNNTTSSDYDNGCFLNGRCPNVKIQAAGQCGSGGSGSSGSGGR